MRRNVRSSPPKEAREMTGTSRNGSRGTEVEAGVVRLRRAFHLRVYYSNRLAAASGQTWKGVRVEPVTRYLNHASGKTSPYCGRQYEPVTRPWYNRPWGWKPVPGIGNGTGTASLPLVPSKRGHLGGWKEIFEALYLTVSSTKMKPHVFAEGNKDGGRQGSLTVQEGTTTIGRGPAAAKASTRVVTLRTGGSMHQRLFEVALTQLALGIDMNDQQIEAVDPVATWRPSRSSTSPIF
ncbi:hypothetical protein B0H13DRAFT_1895251 [Mycena leptocephala]|nr:hypothetical protein B0H13DRAFT_1895251 [Mycena leptocephala]